MIPAPFKYVAADSAAHAIELLARHGEDAKVLAGGHSLLPMMKLRLAAPEVLIDIARAKDLAGISVDGDDLVIGATTRHADLASSEQVKADAPLLAHAASLVGDPQIRHRGTIGGSPRSASSWRPLGLSEVRAPRERLGDRRCRCRRRPDRPRQHGIGACPCPRRRGSAGWRGEPCRRRRARCAGHVARRGHPRRPRVPRAPREGAHQAGA